MNVSEKILEEIDTEVQKQRELRKGLKGTPGYRLYEKAASVFKGIVTKHMDELPDGGWIPVSKRLPEPDKMVVVTVHCSEWISDYDSVWVPENQKIHHSEECLVSMGYVVNDLGDWAFFDRDGYEIPCDKEFGKDKGDVYSVVTAWRPFEELEPYKGGE